MNNIILNNMKKIIGLTAAVIILLAVGGCSLYGGQQTAAPNPAPSANSAGNSVSINNFAFAPAALTVKKGQTVTWTNNDSVAHSLKASAFNSDILNNGQSFSFTFNQAGSFDYGCGIHPAMKGKIIVE